MISNRSVKNYCCEDLSLIENYEEAINDNTQIWDCHHRLETDEQKSIQDLKDEGRYYNVPASELIFLSPSDHHRLHRYNASESTLQKQSESMKLYYEEHQGINKGENSPNYGRKRTDEFRKKRSELMKGENNPMYGKGYKIAGERNANYWKNKTMPEEIRQKMRINGKGKKSGPKGKHKVWDNKELNKYHYE